MKYRIRMLSLKWYVFFYDDSGKWMQTHGPFATQSEAEAMAKETDHRDWDKGA